MAQFVNFYPGFDARHPFFDVFAGTQLRVGSVFGHSREALDVLFSGEGIPTLRHDGSHFTWEAHEMWGANRRTGKAFWFYGTPGIDHPRALFVPVYFYLWARYAERPGGIQSCATRGRKEFGISFIVSNAIHGNLVRRRMEVAEALSKWFPVHAPEKLRPHFPAGTRVRFHDIPDKLEFASRYQFSLCFENQSLPGYLSEKLFDAQVAGAVPLYEGDPGVRKWFRGDSFIDCAGLSAEEIAGKIEAARQDGAVAELVDSQREKLSLVSLPEMMARISVFAKAAAADRDRLLHRGRKWIRRAVGI